MIHKAEILGPKVREKFALIASFESSCKWYIYSSDFAVDNIQIDTKSLN